MAYDHPLPNRVAGDLALDLANTISWLGTRREVDHLADVHDVLAWARAVGLIDADYSPRDELGAELLRDVHALREAITMVGAAIASGSPPEDDGLSTIRDFAARGLAAAALVGLPAQLCYAPRDRIVGPLAWAALDLLRGGETAFLKQCPPEDCRWLFVDRTKNHSRRWCDMATCGNRAKARRSR